MSGDETLTLRKQFFTEKEQELEQKIAELETMLSFLKWKKWYYEAACEAGTEAIHFIEGSKMLDPEVLASYNKRQKDKKRRVSQTPHHYKD